MADSGELLVQQDATVAKVAETCLRMMAGSVSPATRRSVADVAKRSPETYPWESVCDLVVGESVDPSDLVNRAISAQRDWVQGGGGASRAAPRAPRPRASNAIKRLIAMAVVRSAFYVIFAVVFAIGLILIRANWGFDLYAFSDGAVDFVRELIGNPR
ncbi:MAG: hypothetical protein O2865_00770 [Planctomycetota bacterium]|nr:hypothetical protein [Planctomycetota bacterium]MDA0934705.1 hypothetical protein [Planctomycetota bacterium]